VTRDIAVDYYQITLGPAHLARVAALDDQPGIRCCAIALASNEATRRYEAVSSPGFEVETVLDGIYESTPLPMPLFSTLRHAANRSPNSMIIDALSDPVQFLLGRTAQRLGIRVLPRWASTVFDHARYKWKEALKGFIYLGWDGYLATGIRSEKYLFTFGVLAADSI